MGSVLFSSSNRKLRRGQAALLLALILLLAAPLVAQKAAPSASAPTVAVTFNLRSSELTVVDAKYRVFYNKFEKKSLPIQGYDLPSAIRDEVMTTLAGDKRFQWRAAGEEDKLDAAKLADEKHRTPDLLSSAKADRVLLVDVGGFSAFQSGMYHNMFIQATVTMIDRASGRKLWKHGIFEKIKFSGNLEKLQSEDQKQLKENVNTLIEKACQRIKTKVAGSKV